MHAHRKPRAALSRRRFVQGAGLASVGLLAGCGRPPLPTSWPWWAPPPTPQKTHRLGWLQVNCPDATAALSQDSFRQGMRELGYVEGQNFVIEQRCGVESLAALQDPAADLVRSGIDVILAAVTSVEAARAVTSKVPSVIVYPTDPVANGIIASLARPGGNITGLTYFAGQLQEKRLDLLRDTVPNLKRVAVLLQGGVSEIERDYEKLVAAATIIGVHVQPLNVQGPDDFEAAFEAAAREGAQALVLADGRLMVSHRARIVALAAEHRLPAIYWHDAFVRAGGLMSYAPNTSAQYRRAAYYVDRILKGAKPADLPVEQPREFEFVVNLNTLQALGLTFPQHLEPLVTEVIR